MKKKYAVLNVNAVQNELCRILKSKDIECEKIASLADMSRLQEDITDVILPFPCKAESIGVSDGNFLLCDYIAPSVHVYAGMLDKSIRNELERKGIVCLDYFVDEAYVLKNAYITAQGALRLLLESTSEYLAGKRALITGFGRIGRALALMLDSLGLQVFVAVRRREAYAEAKALGFDAFMLNQLPSVLFYFDYIFNTVPYRIFPEKDVAHLRDDALYFELASAPFGAEKADFDSRGKQFVNGSSLPGRYFPTAVAENIADYILSHKEVTICED